MEFLFSCPVSCSKSDWIDLAREKNNVKLKGSMKWEIVSLQPKAMMCKSCAAVTSHYRAPQCSSSTWCRDIKTVLLSTWSFSFLFAPFWKETEIVQQNSRTHGIRGCVCNLPYGTLLASGSLCHEIYYLA